MKDIISKELLFNLKVGSGLACLNFMIAAPAFSQAVVRRPNILFAISDDQSYPHTGAYGCQWVKTPAFDRVAKEGVLFMNCYTPNAKSGPSRACIVTGRYSWQLEAAGNHVAFFPEKFPSFCEVLTAKTNYFVGYTGKGVEPMVAAGRQLSGKPYNSINLTPPTKGISNTDYAANFQQFLKDKPADKPFFFWYGGREPHRGYEFNSGVKKGGKSLNMIDKVLGFWPDNDTVRTDMLDYAFEIEYFDNQLAKMIKMLEETGELENTIIIVTSDNGMPFPRCKGTEYEFSNHLPLAVMWPEGIIRTGRKITDYVSFVDLAPTFLELAGINDFAKAGMQPVQGKSLLPILKSAREGQVQSERDYVLLGQERHDVGRPDDVGYPIRSIIKNDFLYLHNFEPSRWPMCNPETGYLNTDGSPTKTYILNMRRRGEKSPLWNLCFGKKGSEELYNIKKDPECLENLINRSEYSKVKSELRDQLFKELKEQGDPRMFGNGQVFDKYPYAEEQRDFYNRYMKGEIKKSSAGWVNSTDFETGPLEN